MNETLLRTVLDERSAGPSRTITDHHGRTGGVRRKVAARRRRRVVAGAGAAALVAVSLVVAVPQVWGGADPAPDGQQVDAAALFPEYLDGYRVVATASAPLADRSVTLTFTPTTPDFVVYTRCDGHGMDNANLGIAGDLSVGSLAVEGLFCILTAPDGGAGELSPWGAVGPHIGVYEGGEPVTLTVELVGADPQFDVHNLPPIPSQGTAAVAIAEPVPFADYPLPPRPAALAPLPERSSVSVELRADAADPNRRIETTMEWDADLAGCDDDRDFVHVYPLSLVSQTPGTLRVLFGDYEAAVHSWWDYGQEEFVARLDLLCYLHDGDEVPIVVEPENMTGDWRVVVSTAGG